MVENLIKTKSFDKIKNYLIKYKNNYFKPLTHNKHYNTILHYAVKYNYKYLLEFMIETNNDINIKNGNGDTPYILLLNIKILKLLIF